MCVVVCIGSNQPLPLLGNPGNTSSLITIVEATDLPDVARDRLKAPYAYYTYALSRCGCAFEYESNEKIREDLKEAPEELLEEALADEEEHRKALGLLSQYLSQHAENNELRVLLYWAEKEDVELEKEITASPSFFGGESFEFPLNSIVHIRA